MTPNPFSNPDVAMDLIARLYYGDRRAAHLVKETVAATDVSEPTVYAVLAELQRTGMVHKAARSKRNVVYQLTPDGKELLEREHFTALEHLLSGAPVARRRELLLQLLLEDMLDELPSEWRQTDRKGVLRKATKEEIEDVKRRLLRLTDALR